MKKYMATFATRLATGFAVLMIYPATGITAPTVAGDLLTWPDNGWYQVQRADTFETICEGSVSAESSDTGGPCLIDNSRYIVINHSSGERFDNVTASGSTPIAGTDTVIVTGNRISWPDNGWYQVQNAGTFASICEGTTSCEVAAGNYVVINHSTGERYDDIQVGSASPDVDRSQTSVSVDGLAISWPDDGWYQVQNLSDYVTVCEGGSECTVIAGNYIVINHTTGERTELTVPAIGADIDTDNLISANFDITVPAFVSNELQVELTWGNRTFNAAWSVDELWQATDEFLANTDNLLTITFYDRNGALALATYEQSLSTGATEAGVYTITADQFDASRWDDDSDGASNLSEMLAGTNPLVADTTTQPPSQDQDQDQDQEEFDLIDASQELITSLAGFQLDKIAYLTADLLYIIAQQTTIQWPDNDYYQAQFNLSQRKSTGTITYCEGGTTCRVLPGTYTVINHTTGERSELKIPYIDIESLAHVTRLPDRFKSVDGVENTDVTVERTQYNCEHGGSVITESSVDDGTQQQMLLIDPAEHDLVSIRERTTTSYLFDQCRLTISDTTLSDGMILVDGDLHSTYTYHNFADYTGYITNSRHQQFNDFSIVEDAGSAYLVHGETESYAYSREGGSFTHYLRNTEIEQYLVSVDGQVTESISNGRYKAESGSREAGYRSTSEESSGIVRNVVTGGQLVTITTAPKLTSRQNYDGYRGDIPSSPFAGTIEMLAEDGSFLFVQANAYVDPDARTAQWADFNYTKANGEQVLSERERYRSPGTASVICSGGNRFASSFPWRSSVTKRLYCERNGQLAVF